jgi:hypothetical protein
LATDAGVPDIEPHAPRPAPGTETGPVWVVRAHGKFVSLRGLRATPIVADTGYFLILDSDGSVLGMGMP